MRVVFMGTPDIAATCLKKIIADGFDVVGVYTQPDRPKGRGMKMVMSPTKEVAIANNIPVFQPENFLSSSFCWDLHGCVSLCWSFPSSFFPPQIPMSFSLEIFTPTAPIPPLPYF